VDRGTGRGARIGRPCAGKTGTSDGHRDAWFAGFTPMLSCVVRVDYFLKIRLFNVCVTVCYCELKFN
jgi:membrane carboxypeptidase/penicillin-binding protein